jgi:hypothetical protein
LSINISIAFASITVGIFEFIINFRISKNFFELLSLLLIPGPIRILVSYFFKMSSISAGRL